MHKTLVGEGPLCSTAPSTLHSAYNKNCRERKFSFGSEKQKYYPFHKSIWASSIIRGQNSSKQKMAWIDICAIEVMKEPLKMHFSHGFSLLSFPVTGHSTKILSVLCCWDQCSALEKAAAVSAAPIAKDARETGRSGNTKETFMGTSLRCPCWEHKIHAYTHLNTYGAGYSYLQRGFCLPQFSIKYYSIFETMLRGYSR